VTLRVSLQIDGDASGAQKAAEATSSAVTDLGKQTDAISQAIAQGFNSAVSSVEKLKNSSQAAGAANDNAGGSALGLAGKLSQVATQAAGAESALAKGAAGAVNLATGLKGLTTATSTVGLLGGAIGIAATAATTFFSLINSGSTEAGRRLEEQARLVGLVRDAYSDATKKAGEFLTQTKAVTLFQAQQNLIGLQSDLTKKATPLVGDSNFAAATPSFAEPFGTDFAVAAQKVGPFQKAIDDLHTSIALGKPDIAAYQESIAAIGRAAEGSNPKLAAQAAELLKNSKEAADAEIAVRKTEAVIALIGGAATDAQRKLLGLTSLSDEFNRFAKSIERQAAALEADAKTAGRSAGETAKLRAEFVLTEAAQQHGITVAGEYADRIAKISDRAGQAAQQLALARLQSETAFNRDQIGRTAIDASVADQLRGAFGDKADLNSYQAELIRTNETLKELKGTTLEVSSGAFRDFRSEIQSGTNALEAFGKAGVNALQRIVDKLADKAFDKLISGGLSSFANVLGIGTGTVGNGGIVLGGPAGPGVFAAAGGGDFGPGWGVVGEKGAEIIKVHAGGVTVYPHEISKPYLPGFADGGSLSPFGNVSRLPFGRQDNEASTSPMQMQVSVGVTVDDAGNLKAYVKSVSTQAATDSLGEFVGSQAFDHHVANAVASGRSARLI
jgi:hypothetical protein